MKSRQKIVLVAFGQALLIAAVAWGVSYEVRQAEQKIADLAELKDPSPFRAVLLGHLNKINVNLLGYVQSRDRAPLEQIVSGEKEFENSVEEFQIQNPRLFPPESHTKILEAYQPFKAAVGKILEASTHQADRWGALLENDDRIMALMERRLRPLAQADSRDGDKRAELVSSLENQLREVPKDLTQYLLNHSGPSSDQVALNERKFDAKLRSYEATAKSLSERGLLKLIERLWIENVEHAQEILDFEKIRAQAFTQILAGYQGLQQTLAAVLPAIRPEVIEAQQQALYHSVLLIITLVAVMLLFATGTTLASARWIYRSIKFGANSVKNAEIGLSLAGTIMSWDAQAERLYGYSAKDIVGSSISTLFASEEEIAHLNAKMKESKQARFDALHVTKKGTRLKVHLTFDDRPAAGGQPAAILLSIYPLIPS